MKSDAWMSRQIDKNTIECISCNHRCKILPNKYGICGVRKNENGKLISLVYSNPVAVNTDPIEKKPLYHFLPSSKVFSVGTVGCNFRCQFCQNWQISQFPKMHDESKILNCGIDLSPKKIVAICKKEKIPAIAYTYNEPAVFFEYTYDTAKLASKNGIKNIYVSNGYETIEALEMIAPYLDAANIDLKSFSEDFYKKICGARISPVKKNIKWLYKNKIHLEITTLLITGKNDSDEEINRIAKFIASISKNIPWHISRFFPNYKMTNIVPTSAEKLITAYQIGKNAGLNFVYIGNLNTHQGKDTICPKCQNILIERDGYFVKSYLKKGGLCPFCNFKLQGFFKKLDK